MANNKGKTIKINDRRRHFRSVLQTVFHMDGAGCSDASGSILLAHCPIPKPKILFVQLKRTDKYTIPFGMYK